MATHDDKNFDQQWYLINKEAGKFDLNVEDVWDDYTGRNVKVVVMETGIDYLHPDLAPNYDSALQANFRSATSDDPYQIGDPGDHGTATAGIIAASAEGRTGTVGIAHDATLSAYRARHSHVEEGMEKALADGIDVVNMSKGSGEDGMFEWGTEQTGGLPALEAALAGGRKDAEGEGRGLVFVKSAGNSRREGEDSAADAIESHRGSIVVASVDSAGEISSSSTSGANLLVSAFGRDGIFTTDVSGPTGYTPTDYTATFNGTSAAAPQVAGVVALMLEANAALGWRDVQSILANSARHVGSEVGEAAEGAEIATSGSASWMWNAADHWNGGGMHFSNDYGFGLVDAKAAVRMAETWTTRNVSANEDTTTLDIDLDPPVRAASSQADATARATVTATEDTEITIEYVDVTIDFEATAMDGVMFHLTSPEGTRIRLFGEDGSTDSHDGNWTFGTNGLRGEETDGEWTLEATAADRQSVEIRNVTITAYGDEDADRDDVFIYTDAYSTFAGTDGHGTSIDGHGGDNTLNAAAIDSATVIDLANDTGVIDGVRTGIREIDRVYTGDGDDRVTGDSVSDYIWTGRGDDTIDGGRDGEEILAGAGADRVDGGGGADRIDGGHGDDTIDGGDGDDLVSGGFGTDLLDGGRGDDTLDLSFYWGRFDADLSAETASHGETVRGFENVIGGDGANRIIGTNGHNRIETRGGADVVHGRWGNDTIEAGAGNDIVQGDGGRDRIDGGAGNDTVRAGSGNDVVILDAGRDQLYGGTGRDLLDGTAEHRDWDFDMASGALRIGGEGETAHEFERVHTGEGNDRVRGTAGGDEIRTGAGNDTVDAKGGSDTVHGGNGHDNLRGQGGNDHLHGDAGNDNIYGQEGHDRLHDGAGTDYVRGDAGNDTVYAGAGRDMYDGGSGTDLIHLGDEHRDYDLDLATGAASHGERADNFENAILGNGRNAVEGTAGANRIEVSGGNDTVRAGSGDDTVLGGAGNDWIDGGWGFDDLDGGAGFDAMDGRFYTGAWDIDMGAGIADWGYATERMVDFEHVLTAGGTDRITGSAGDDLIQSGAGNDTVRAGAGDDTVDGGWGFDDLDGGAGFDVMDGSFYNGAWTYDMASGVVDWGGVTERAVNFERAITGAGDDRVAGTDRADVIETNAGDDRIEARGGHDRIVSGAGRDDIDAGAGDDVVETLLDGDTIEGGAGFDTLVTAGTDMNVSFSMADGWLRVDPVSGQMDVFDFEAAETGGGDDWIGGTDGANAILANGGNDTLLGGLGDDALSGGAGRDTLEGGRDNDRLDGGAEADRLVGGLGDDALTGGAGADSFVFQGFDDGHDRITDFEMGIDTLDLRETGITDLLGLNYRHEADGLKMWFGETVIDFEDVHVAHLHGMDILFA